MALHSKMTSKGQTTIPTEVRQALKIKAGDRLEYVLAEGGAMIRVHPGLLGLRGALASDRGEDLPFSQIRAVAAARARRAGKR